MFLPNMTWLQPPGYVHKMIKETWAEETVASTAITANHGNGTAGEAPAQVTFIAQRAAESNALVLRAVNNDNAEHTLTVAVKGGAKRSGSSTVQGSFIGQLAPGMAMEVNTPGR